MTQQSHIYFGRPQSTNSTVDGLEETANVLYAIDALIIGNDDLSIIDSKAISGLSTILNSVQHAIEKAAREIEKQPAAFRQGFEEGVKKERANIFAAMKKQGIPFKSEQEIQKEENENLIKTLLNEIEREREPGLGEADTENAPVVERKSYPKLNQGEELSIRDIAIASTWRRGHSSADISQAMSLKKVAVEKTIERMQTEGYLPEKPDMVQNA